MVRKVIVIAAVVLVAGVALLQAQRSSRPGQQGPGMMAGDSGKTMGCPMMLAMTMPRNIVPVEDGVIVSIGNKLLKYDSDLSLKKEVTIPVDTAQARALLRGMGHSCPMMMDGDAGSNGEMSRPEKKSK